MFHGLVFGGATLSSLRSFEAAARLGSLRAAAEELGLSASAISHSVGQLEDALGTRLFERAGRGVRLTPEGQALLTRLSVAFEEIRRGIEDVGQRSSTLLRLHSAPSFAALWLVPRLTSFTRAHPQVELRLAADTNYARFVTDDFDLDIVYGPIQAEGVVTVPLGEEFVTPLCAPEIAEAIREPADILRCPLIQSEQKQVRWDDWLRENAETTRPKWFLRFDRSFLALSAAAQGLGIALESTRLAADDLAAGRLVAPLQGKARDIVDVGHSLVMPRARPLRAPVTTFGTWLLGKLGLPSEGLAGHVWAGR